VHSCEHWEIEIAYEDRLSKLAEKSEPVATVYTMEALVPGGHEVSHVSLLKPLPKGTKLYTTPQSPQLLEAAEKLLEFHDGPVQAKRPDIFGILMNRLRFAIEENRGLG
jgi:hypothetical protein